MTSQDLDQWRAAARAWLGTVLEPITDQSTRWGEGEADFSVFRDQTDEQETAVLEAIRAYRRQRYDAGYGAITVPADKGGAGLGPLYSIAFSQEESRFAVPPSTELISVTTGLVGPSLAMFGTEEQRAELAHPFLRTDLLCCQLFSEPGAGSDLASLGTRAVRERDGWVLNGQKVWSSGARHADYGMVLVRTNRDVPKQAGITALIVPMDAPGLAIQPIRQMSGPASFNEVFLSDVFVPDSMRIGEVDDGWRIANVTLGLERQSSGTKSRRKGGTFGEVIELARALGRTGDPVLRQRLADLYIRHTLQVATTERVGRATAAGHDPGPAGSLGKLTASANLTLTVEVAEEVLGARMAAETGEWGTFEWTQHLLGAPGYRLAGGTDEVQHNIIAERVLGLPREPSVDKGVPFSELTRR
jgi:alkylation response protein AidB-like acyl-CoA dehydrogenase